MSALTSATAFSPSLEAVRLAASMYNAAREGNKAVIEEGILDGLPPNLTNEKGDTLVRSDAHLSGRFWTGGGGWPSSASKPETLTMGFE